ncbi:hypothetical protein LINPERPRIM_LOCUS1490 [Linum perenne]
MMTTRFFATAV